MLFIRKMTSLFLLKLVILLFFSSFIYLLLLILLHMTSFIACNICLKYHQVLSIYYPLFSWSFSDCHCFLFLISTCFIKNITPTRKYVGTLTLFLIYFLTPFCYNYLHIMVFVTISMLMTINYIYLFHLN